MVYHLLGDSCSDVPKFNIQTEIDKFFPGGVEDNSISRKFSILFANPLISLLPYVLPGDVYLTRTRIPFISE